jgi:hypothetical protein
LAGILVSVDVVVVDAETVVVVVDGKSYSEIVFYLVFLVKM